MILRTLNDVVAYLCKEINHNRKREISFVSSLMNIDIAEVYGRVVSVKPELLLCVETMASSVICLGLWNNYTVTVAYNDVYPSFVKLVDTEYQVKSMLLEAADAHRKQEYFVCRKSDSAMVLSAIKSIVTSPEHLNSFVSGVQPSVLDRAESEYVGIIVRLMYSCDYRTAKERKNQRNKEINRIVSLARSAGIEDWKKAYEVLKFCVNNWEYELGSGTGLEFTSYGALVNKRAVCMGFSLAVCAIFKELGIPCKYICGTKNNEGHAWNMIYVMGGWFYIDVTDAIGMKDPLFHWGVTCFDDGRTVITEHGQNLVCHCDKNYIMSAVNRR